jgi:hypothetical protein
VNTLFFRLLSHEDKAAALSEAIGAVRAGRTPDAVVHAVDPASFRQVPGAPFAYWVSDRIRRLFTELPRFEGDGRTVRVGLQTSDDFRFVRAWWEVSAADILDGGNGPDWRGDIDAFQTWCRQRTFQGKRWVPFAKGGAYSPYYADLHLVVNWARDGAEIRGFDRAFIRNEDFYFRPGLTWPSRTTSGISFRVLNMGSIFGHKGPAAFFEAPIPILGLLQSAFFGIVISLQLAAADAAARSYEVGLIQRSPIPNYTGLNWQHLGDLTRSAVALKQSLNTADDTSHVFVVPALLQVPGETLAERAQGWAERVAATEAKLTALQQQIDAVACQLYGITEADQRAMQVSPEEMEPGADAEDDEDAADAEDVAADARSLVFDLLSYALGLALGRWDVRYATQQHACPELPDPFAPLPVCAPGTLSNAHGLPAQPDDVSDDYPLRISWPGILVHDDGHPEDLVGRIRQAFEAIWRAQASDVEQEACDLLGVRSLRDYFAKPNNFFAAHLKRYSKSRRQAPIYWPLQTPSGSYALWLYSHCLTDQTLYTCVNDFVGPKLRDVTEQLAALRARTDRNRQEEQELERLLDFEQELQDLRDELLRVAGFWKPNLYDGVQITAAPLWKLFQHRPWQRKLKDTWDKLENGDYDWAHLASSIWPDRVREQCRHDKSLAIAHGLEDLYEAPPEQPRPSRRRRRRTG